MRGALLPGPTGEGGERAATPLELFFDLCFVVAVAEVAFVLHEDPTLAGAAIAAGLFVPVWWAWMGFTWQATAYDSDDAPHRLGTLAAMLGVLVLAASVDSAAAGDGSAFALAAAGLRLPLLWLWLRAHAQAPGELRGFSSRYIAGTTWAILLWATSALFAPPFQQALWAVAIGGEMLAPYAAVRTTVWPAYDRTHIVERYGLFTLIVLGESILAAVTGMSRTGIDLEAAMTAAFGFVAAAALWWLYFDRVGAGGLGTSKRAGFTWGYGHLAVWAGIAAVGVGTALAIEGSVAAATEVAATGPVGPVEAAGTPHEVLPLAAALAIAALAVIGATSRGAEARRSVRTRVGAAGALVLLAGLAGSLSPPVVALAVAAVLCLAATADRAPPSAGPV
jgi:low temperature requirement protein LtrA